MLKQRELSHQLRQEKVQSELKFLKNQVQPHFLFNTLNNLYGMVLSEDKNSANSIIKLSDMLSYMLYESNDDLVPLSKEVMHLNNYIDLERIRYNRKLTLDLDLAKVSPELLIAPHLLIPFVENAFKHGPGKEEGHSHIQIALSIVANTLHFKVRNTYSQSAMSKEIRSGIGLINVQKRLKLIYPNQFDLQINKSDWFEIDLTLTLSKRTKIEDHAETEMHYH